VVEVGRREQKRKNVKNDAMSWRLLCKRWGPGAGPCVCAVYNNVDYFHNRHKHVDPVKNDNFYPTIICASA